jgi:hypothetical protein
MNPTGRQWHIYISSCSGENENAVAYECWASVVEIVERSTSFVIGASQLESVSLARA